MVSFIFSLQNRKYLPSFLYETRALLSNTNNVILVSKIYGYFRYVSVFMKRNSGFLKILSKSNVRINEKQTVCFLIRQAV